MSRLFGPVAAFCGLLVATNAEANLVPLDLSGTPGDVDAYYDTVLNITWLRDANYAATTGFASGGLMSFGTAQSWAAGLDIYGITGWRVANVGEPDSSCSVNDTFNGSAGFNCTGGELGYMFYTEMGGTAGTNITQSHNATFDLFTNFGDSEYWSATPLGATAEHGYRNLFYFFAEGLAPDGTPAGWVGLDYPTNDKLAWVVHDGDVADLPDPASLSLLGFGIVFLTVSRRKRTERPSVDRPR